MVLVTLMVVVVVVRSWLLKHCYLLSWCYGPIEVGCRCFEAPRRIRLPPLPEK